MNATMRVLGVLVGIGVARIAVSGLTYLLFRMIAGERAGRPDLVGSGLPPSLPLLVEAVMFIALVALAVLVIYWGRPVDRIVVIGFGYVLSVLAAAMAFGT